MEEFKSGKKEIIHYDQRTGKYILESGLDGEIAFIFDHNEDPKRIENMIKSLEGQGYGTLIVPADNGKDALIKKLLNKQN